MDKELDKATAAGSSVVKITRDKMVPIGVINTSINFVGPSVVKVTRDMINH